MSVMYRTCNVPNRVSDDVERSAAAIDQSIRSVGLLEGNTISKASKLGGTRTSEICVIYISYGLFYNTELQVAY